MNTIKLPNYIINLLNMDDIQFLIEIKDISRLKTYLSETLYKYYATKIHYNESYRYAKMNSVFRYNFFNKISVCMNNKITKLTELLILNN